MCTNDIKTISVAMSTYNGESYLTEQINSILGQKDVKVHLFVRDDGSSDKTMDILNDFKNKNSDICVISGENLGFNRSFWTAIQAAFEMTQDQYFAFADQDDVWDCDKLSIALDTMMNDREIPQIYCSNLAVCNHKLQFVTNLFPESVVKTTKEQCMAQIFCFGCTAVFNRAAAALYLRKYFSYSHDAWLYMICVFAGQAYYDETPHLRYRRHTNNYGNSGQSLTPSLLKKTRQNLSKIAGIKRLSPLYSDMANSLLKEYADVLDEESIRLLERLAHYRNNVFSKLELLFGGFADTLGVSKRLSIKLRILFNSW